MLSVADRLMQGAIDVHCHGYPELALDWLAPEDDATWIQQARQVGMRAVVIKSHMWPTMGRAYLLRQAVPGIEVFGSITLNPVAGGLNPWVVEAAAKLGARVVWMPTWSALNDIKRNGAIRLIRKNYALWKEDGPGLAVATEDGRAKPEAAAILQVAKEHDLAVFTGHLSAEEAIALAREASRIDFGKLVFGHPNSPSVGASLDQMKEVVALGGWVEFCFVGALPRMQRFHPQQMASAISVLDPARCVLSTDVGHWWCPPGPQMLRMYLATMFDLGLSEGDLRTMVQENPARLLGLATKE